MAGKPAKAKTSAERQAAYRQRHLEDIDGGGTRLSVVISHHAKAALKRYAREQGLSQKAALEELLIAYDPGEKTQSAQQGVTA